MQICNTHIFVGRKKPFVERFCGNTYSFTDFEKIYSPVFFLAHCIRVGGVEGDQPGHTEKSRQSCHNRLVWRVQLREECLRSVRCRCVRAQGVWGKGWACFKIVI